MDNLAVTPGSGADLRMVEKTAIKVQAVVLDMGGAGAEALLVAGRLADAASLPVALSTENVAQVGIVTETAPASDTASSGLNGRLQRIAQRITSLIALIPAALGANGGFKVEGVASGTAIPVSGTITAVTAISNALPAGTNAIGKLAANSGVDIGDVDVASVAAGENHLGEIGGKSAVPTLAMTTDTAAYASGDLIADTQQLDAFFRKTDGTGVINSINIVDKDAQGVAFYIVVMKTSTSLGTENSAPNISDANMAAGFQGIVTLAASDYKTISGAKVATIRNIGLPVKAVAGTDDIYVAILNATGTPTFTATGLELSFGVLLD